MDFKIQLSGLNDFLGAVYGGKTQLSSLLSDLGFERTQIDLLSGHFEQVVPEFVAVIKDRLANGSVKAGHVFQVACRRYGLDGESPETLESIAKKHNISVKYARQLEEEAFEKCRFKPTLNDFRKSLQHIAVAELSKIAPAPTQSYISEKLFRLTNLQADTDLTCMDYEEKRTAILKRVRAELDALDAEYKPQLKEAEENIASLTSEIKNDVLLRGDSVEGGAYRAVYIQGRSSWDNLGLTKYAAAHPSVLDFRKPGQASVALRTLDGK